MKTVDELSQGVDSSEEQDSFEENSEKIKTRTELKKIKKTKAEKTKEEKIITTENSQEENQPDQFAHLGNASKVISTKTNKGLFSAMMGGVILIFIFMLMISGGHHQKVVHQEQAEAPALNNDSVLKQNEKRLELLQNQSGSSSTVPNNLSRNFSGFSQPQDDKAMIARRNAPTQMYTIADTSTSSNNSNVQSTNDQVNDKNNDKNNNNKMMAGRDALSQFANSQSDSAPIVSGAKIQHPRYTVAEGELIPAVLETAVNSDLPGMVRAVTTMPLYAYTGETPLIPAG